MRPLPLPPLEQTLHKFLTAITPVFSPNEVTQAQAAAEKFLQGDGPALQTKLENYAQTQAKQGKSWVSDYWLEGYLTGRNIKALSSNVGFQIHFESETTQHARAADFIYRIAQTHRDYLQNNITPPDDGRGNSLSMDGWKVLSGAMRLPKAQCDDFYYGSDDIRNRHISVLWKGSHYILPITDDNGHVFSASALEQALQTLTQQSESADMPFSLVSALPSENAEQYLHTLCEQPHNKTVYEQLKNSWFCLSLFDSSHDENRDEIALLQTQTFTPGRAWQYKPFTYQIDLSSPFMCVHIEHTGLDGGTLGNILSNAFSQNRTTDATSTPSPTLSNWAMDDALIADIKNAVSQANQSAKDLTIEKFTTDYSKLTTKISHDALIQFSLVYAQLKTFERLRNTYEAVDTSHYLAGRTECLRANTPQARNLCEKLLNDQAQKDDLDEALKAHKTWVIDCKSGQAIDRHLYALSQQAQPNHDDFFDYVKQFCGRDFLSTSTVGTQAPIRRFVFAPTSSDGFGVNYSIGKTDYEYCLIANAHSKPDLQTMKASIQEGVAKLITLAIE